MSVKVRVTPASRVVWPAKGKEKEVIHEAGAVFSCDAKVAASLIQGGTVTAVGEGGDEDANT